jgi:hypothetical protein
MEKKVAGYRVPVPGLRPGITPRRKERKEKKIDLRAFRRKMGASRWCLFCANFFGEKREGGKDYFYSW